MSENLPFRSSSDLTFSAIQWQKLLVSSYFFFREKENLHLASYFKILLLLCLVTINLHLLCWTEKLTFQEGTFFKVQHNSLVPSTLVELSLVIMG